MDARVMVILLALVAITYAAQQYYCPENETWDICGRICEPNCMFPNIRPNLCGACRRDTQSCRCMPGYLRDAYARRQACLLPDDCTVTDIG